MTVEQKIKKIVDSMEGVSYLFDNWQTANIRLDKIKLPAVLNLLPVSGTFNLGRQQLRDCPNCMMAFMDKTKFDFDGTENAIEQEWDVQRNIRRYPLFCFL